MTRNRSITVTRALAVLVGAVACSDGADIIGTPEAPPSGGGSMDRGPGATPMPGALTGPPPEPAAGAGGATSEPNPPEPDAMNPDEQLPSGVDEGAPVVPDVTFVVPRGPCDVADRVGGFSIEKQAQFGVVQGTVTDGVVPTAIPSLALSDGPCKLLERRTLACIPTCVGAETCGEAGACIPYPRQVSVGEVTVSGLTQETRMSPLAPGNSYFAPGADNPPYAVGREVVLSAAGAGERGAFQLFGMGSEPLIEAPRWQLAAGQDLSIEWPAPTSSVETTVLVELTIDQHGASPLTLSCEFPDTGSATVPASLVDRMIDSGVSGFPNGRITRRTADHADVAGRCVDLVVGSPLAASIGLAGYTPCNGPEDCPSGQDCNVVLERCE
jgi:hypothetical protein